jgi:hypothetical protein
LVFNKGDGSVNERMDIPLFLVGLPLAGEVKESPDNVSAPGGLLDDILRKSFSRGGSHPPSSASAN